MTLRKALTTGKSYGLWSMLLSAFFMLIKRWNHRIARLFSYHKSIILQGNSSIGIHHHTSLMLQGSKIIVENGTFKAGTDFGYYDGGMVDPERDVCRIHLVNSTLRIKGNVSLYPGVQIFASNAEIVIGNGTKINGNTHLIALNKIEIGEFCNIAQGVIIRDNDGHKLSTDGSAPAMHCLPVSIGNHCWLGQRAMVLKGVTIGSGVVIAAGAVVTRDVEQRALAAGVPARTIFNNVTWED